VTRFWDRSFLIVFQRVFCGKYKKNPASIYKTRVQSIFFGCRVCFIFGGPVDQPITDITPTLLTSSVIASLRQVDYLANQVLQMAGAMDKVSQMPIVSSIRKINLSGRVLTGLKVKCYKKFFKSLFFRKETQNYYL
jgi:hypothetical protein